MKTGRIGKTSKMTAVYLAALMTAILILPAMASPVRADEKTYTITVDMQGRGDHIEIKDLPAGTNVGYELEDFYYRYVKEHKNPEGYQLAALAPGKEYDSSIELETAVQGLDSVELSDDMTVYAIWFEEIPEVEYTLTVPACGTKVATSYDDEGWARQNPQPEVELSEGGKYKLDDYGGTEPHSFYWDYFLEGYLDETIAGGEEYAVQTWLRADYGYGFSDDHSVKVNGGEFFRSQSNSMSYYIHANTHMSVIADFKAEHEPGSTVIENRVEPTTEADGSYDEVIYCKVCEKEVSRNKVTIPKLPDEQDDKEDHKGDGSSKTVKPASLSLNKTKKNMAAGKNFQLKTTIAPADTTDRSVIWKSSNPSVASVDKNGKVTAHRYGTAVITASSKADKSIKDECKITTRFKDVLRSNTDKGVFKAVYWAAKNKISTAKKAYKPDKVITRGQFLDMLWRMEGMPEAKTAKLPYTDVNKKNTKYYDAICWAFGEKLLTGYANKLAGQDKSLTKRAAALILYRYAGRPKISAKTSFNDVKNSKAIAWVGKNRVIKASAGKQFRPTKKCTRGEATVYLYKIFKMGRK